MSSIDREFMLESLEKARRELEEVVSKLDPKTNVYTSAANVYKIILALINYLVEESSE